MNKLLLLLLLLLLFIHVCAWPFPQPDRGTVEQSEERAAVRNRQALR